MRDLRTGTAAHRDRPATQASATHPAAGRRREPVPVRTILATIGLVVATVLALLIVRETARVLIWLVIGTVFAVAVHPAVDWVERHVPRCPRGAATLAVFLAVLAGLAGVAAAIVVPLVREGSSLGENLPRLIEDARHGRGAGGELLQRIHAAEWLERNQDRLNESVAGLGAPAVGALRTAATGLVATVTIITIAFLMVLQGPRLIDAGLGLLHPERAERARRVGRECSRAITGYVTGNLLISAICGTLTYLVLRLLGVPFPGLIAMFVAIADLVPLVGATIGAGVAALAGFTQSTEVGVALIVFFVVYQQVENHVLQPLIYSRTVQLNPLGVLVSLLILGELAGVLGALLAVPVAGIVRALARDAWEHHRPAAR